jgi:hypothetical protein
MVSMEPPAALEEEFNDWYDTEHFPQRRAMPGFLSATRWVCLDGWPRWMALYDLQDRDALESAAYRANAGPHSTPWSRRLLPRTIGRQRVVADVIDGAATPIALQYPERKTSRLVLVGFPVATSQEAARVTAAAADALATAPAQHHLLQLRSFFETPPLSEAGSGEGRAENAESGTADAEDGARRTTARDGTVWLLAAFATPVTRADLSAFSGRLAGRGATTLNVYGAYRRGP